MSALLNPPPLLSVAIVVAAAAGGLWWGLRRAPRAGEPAAPAIDERDELWGLPDPSPPPKQPYRYPTQVAVTPEPQLDTSSPASDEMAAQPIGTGRPAEPGGVVKPVEPVREIQLADLFARSRPSRPPAGSEGRETAEHTKATDSPPTGS